MRRASIYALWVLATAGLVTIGLIAWPPWSTHEDSAITSTQEEARAAAEGLFVRSTIEERECTFDERASNQVKFTFVCVYTEILYSGLALDVLFREGAAGTNSGHSRSVRRIQFLVMPPRKPQS